MVKYLWSEAEAALLRPGLDELVYRSNLIGSDRSVCNWGGGNTSMKTTEKDFRGGHRGDVGERQRLGLGDDVSGPIYRVEAG